PAAAEENLLGAREDRTFAVDMLRNDALLDPVHVAPRDRPPPPAAEKGVDLFLVQGDRPLEQEEGGEEPGEEGEDDRGSDELRRGNRGEKKRQRTAAAGQAGEGAAQDGPSAGVGED